MRFLAAGSPLLVALLRENASDPARPGPGAAPASQAATAVCGAAAKNSPASRSTVTCSPRLHFFFRALSCIRAPPGAASRFIRARGSLLRGVGVPRTQACLRDSVRFIFSGNAPAGSFPRPARIGDFARKSNLASVLPPLATRCFGVVQLLAQLFARLAVSLQLLVLRIDHTCNACAHSAIGLAESCT